MTSPSHAVLWFVNVEKVNPNKKKLYRDYEFVVYRCDVIVYFFDNLFDFQIKFSSNRVSCQVDSIRRVNRVQMCPY